ncbi:MAG: PilZ domain-containing protein [Treponema sp.]|jgi:hypothetical protein|nr:PilZ domain-containing protein [Treponema sp.]
MEAQGDISGKKTFLLYPHSVIKDEVLDELIMNGYETYPLRDHERARRLLERFPGSIMFINIDERLSEAEWEVYIRELQGNPKTRESQLGILSYNNDQGLMQKYLIEMALPCGYIQLKLGVKESTKIILDALQAIEAKGRRKFIRAFCDDDAQATMNYKDPEGETFYGKLLDISSAGFAAKIGNFSQFPPNSLLRNVQLKLHGSLIMANAVLMGNRRDDKDIYILLFDPKMLQDHKVVLHHYIKQSLQRYIEQLKV